jgi:hypothetical protein
LHFAIPQRYTEEVELQSIRKMFVCAADTGYSKGHNAKHVRR